MSKGIIIDIKCNRCGANPTILKLPL